MENIGNRRNLIPMLRRLIFQALTYIVLGAAGLTLAIPPGYASPIFPAAGFALVCVLWFGNEALLAVWLGSALLNLSHAWLFDKLDPVTAAVAAVIATGAMVQAWAGHRLVSLRQGPAWRQMEREQDAFGFMLLGGLLAGAASATISVTGLQAFGIIHRTERLFTWWNWYVGDVLGILTFAPLTMCLLNKQSALWRERRRRILVPMLLTLGFVVAAFYGASKWEQQAQDNQLQADSVRIAERIADRLTSHREVLSSLHRFIEVTPDFSFRQFERYTRHTLQDNPDIFALSFNDLITDEQRPAFEQTMSGLSPLGSYRITERDSEKRLVPAASRSEYVPVRYIVPPADNQPAVGFDIYSEPVRRDAIERARASKSMAVTAPIRLVQERQQRVGVLELWPVYGAPAEGYGDLKDRLLGFAVAVVKVDQMIEMIAGQMPAGLVFQLMDPQAPNGQELLYCSHAQDNACGPSSRAARWKTRLHMGDRDWELSVFTTEGYRQEHRTWMAWAMGMIGLLFAALLQILMLGITGQTAVMQRKNEALKAAEEALRDMNVHLERKVEERTVQLSTLQDEIVEALARTAKSETLFRAIFEQAPLGVALADSITARIYEVNERYARIVGRTREEMTSISWIQITHPDDVSTQLANAARLNAGEIGGYQMNKRYIRPDGSLIWVNLTVAAVILEAGEKPSHLAMIEDVTERRDAEERLRCITDSAYDAILMMDPQGAISYWNPAAEKILGYRPEEALGKKIHHLLALERYLADFQTAFPGFVRTGFGNALGKTMELSAKHKDGHEIAVALSLSSVLLKGARHTVGILRDITPQRELEESLRAAKQAADSASSAKSEFLAHMSHEIRTPMNAILGLAQVLERDALSTDQRTMVQRILASGRSLLGILNDILDFSKIEAGQLRIEMQPFELGPLLAQIDSLQGSTARTKGLSFVIEAPEGFEDRLVGDPLRLEQVLLNLAGNAVKFTESGGITLQAIPQRMTETSVRLRFEVRDTGIGIAPEALANLFTSFNQADSSITRRFGGTGLGLAICKRMVELMGGEIGVESNVGAGSTFWIELSFQKEAGVKAIPQPEQREIPPGVPRLSGLHFLVVDDSPMNLDVVARALTLEGASSTRATDGRQAVHLLQADPRGFDVVLMDVQMPVMDGLTATRIIRQELSLTELPVIAFTAGVLEQERREAVNAGVNDFLPKPLDIEEMVRVIQRWARPGTYPQLITPSPAPLEAVPARDLPAGFPYIAGLDVHRAATTLGNDLELFFDLLERFVQNYGDAAQRARSDMTRGDTQTAARGIHTLRGVAGNIGAMDLMRTAQDLEEAIKQGRSDLEGLWEELSSKLTAVVEAIGPWIRKTDAAAPSPESATEPQLDPVRLDVLRDALARHDLSALAVFSELQPAIAAHYGREATQTLAEAIKGLRFDDALALMEEDS